FPVRMATTGTSSACHRARWPPRRWWGCRRPDLRNRGLLHLLLESVEHLEDLGRIGVSALQPRELRIGPLTQPRELLRDERRAGFVVGFLSAEVIAALAALDEVLDLGRKGLRGTRLWFLRRGDARSGMRARDADEQQRRGHPPDCRVHGASGPGRRHPLMKGCAR